MLHVSVTTCKGNAVHLDIAGGLLFCAFLCPATKVAGYYVIPSELLSVCPSVRPSAVDHSCPLHNFDTVRDNFTKLGRNIKHDQTTCRD